MIMRITVLTDNINSWIMPYVNKLHNELSEHEITHIYDYKKIKIGDVMLILSCEKILPKEYLKFHRNNIVVHPSKLPEGKGWSPLAWQILEGKNKIPISLFEAAPEVDSGNVYLLRYIELNGRELNEEIKSVQVETTISMIKEYLNNYTDMVGKAQSGKGTLYSKRSLKDSELDINKTIKEQFNLFRVVDNERYPAYFCINDVKYILKIYKEE